MNEKVTVNSGLIESFLHSKQNEGWSDVMVKRSKKRLEMFCNYWEEESSSAEKVEETFRKWSETLKSRGLSDRTIGEYVSVGLKFLAFIGVEDCSFMNLRSINLKGKRYGELKVLEKAGGRISSERSFLWKCQCSCGKIVEIPANQLTKGYHTSCGCQKAVRLNEINQYVDGTSLKMIFSDTVRKDNTSGHKGIYQKDGRWAARIQYKGKRYYLGTYDRLEEAIDVRKEAEEKIREVCADEFL